MPAEEVFIALGSNLGDSITIVEEAIQALDHINHCRLLARSSLYRNEAISDIPQDDYINAVVKVETNLEPMALLLELQAIEHAYYRHRENDERWAPRTLDLDIILFGNRHMNDSHLTVPHPEFSRRRFVLEPMFEIEGDRFIAGYGSLSYLINAAPVLRMEKLDRPDA
ncbi:MAG: 2-amino-4-hydroxy-6-hydroxymethyldihydropteridine diphosphokinase [Gammaproteobacteria bacterium]|nr:2-amino-4-hydroxy-6-hydroxymethyldihydropteridine diphosphokinase [Gammaproteobacteria bacterium]MDH3534155.1 2-amino-4-hydroxy-6-hydroxymethyldihydropteridine diphosphokinase [Gammaproteobacteria bacterium]